MINLELGNNDIILTLKEKSSLSNPVYILKVINTQSTSDVKYLVLSDSSTSSEYFNRFDIEVVNDSVSEDLSNGVIYLLPGQYRYEAFESTTSDINDSTGCNLESGVVWYDASTTTEFNDSTLDTEYILQ